MEDDQEHVSQRDESFSQTVDEQPISSRNSNANPNIAETSTNESFPTDESTIPHPVHPANSNRLQARTNTPVQTPIPHQFESEESAAPEFTPSQHDQSTPFTPQSQLSVYDSRELITELENTTSTLEAQLMVITDHAEEQMRILHERYKNEEEKQEIAIGLLFKEQVALNDEITNLSTQFANTRVELKNVKDQLKDSKSKHSGETQRLNQELKALGECRTKMQRELSGLRFKFKDLGKLSNDRKSQLEILKAENKRLKDNSIGIWSSNSQLRLQNRMLQQLARSSPSCDSESRPAIQSTSHQIRPSFHQQCQASEQTTRQVSSLRFSNRTQIRDISPQQSTSLVGPNSPQEIGSEIPTMCCHKCKLFEKEGCYRWICGFNERAMVVYREQCFVIFVPGVAEIQMFGEGADQGQLIIFWKSSGPTKEITVFRLNGTREDYRVDQSGNIVYRKVFYSDDTASQATGNQSTPLVAEIETIQSGKGCLEVRHREFKLNMMKSELLRANIFQECLQITTCFCDGNRFFNVQHCDDSFKQKSLCISVTKS